MTTVTKEQADMALDALENNECCEYEEDNGGIPPSQDVRAYITNLEERVKVLEDASGWVYANWDNQDISHGDFRVQSAIKSKAALAGGKEG